MKLHRPKTPWLSALAYAFVPVAILGSMAFGEGYQSGGSGSGAWTGDTYTPQSGTLTVTGALSVSGSITSSGSNLISTSGFVQAGGSGFRGGSGVAILQDQSGGNIIYGTNAAAAARTDEIGQANISHFAGGSGVPTSPTAGTGCGTSSAPSITGNDFMGTINVTCGSAGTAGNPYVTATFAHAYVTNAPACVFIPANENADTGLVTSKEKNTSTTTTLSVSCGTGGTCSTGALSWTYICSQQ